MHGPGRDPGSVPNGTKISRQYCVTPRLKASNSPAPGNARGNRIIEARRPERAQQRVFAGPFYRPYRAWVEATPESPGVARG